MPEREKPSFEKLIVNDPELSEALNIFAAEIYAGYHSLFTPKKIQEYLDEIGQEETLLDESKDEESAYDAKFIRKMGYKEEKGEIPEKSLVASYGSKYAKAEKKVEYVEEAPESAAMKFIHLPGGGFYGPVEMFLNIEALDDTTGIDIAFGVENDLHTFFASYDPDGNLYAFGMSLEDPKDIKNRIVETDEKMRAAISESLAESEDSLIKFSTSMAEKAGEVLAPYDEVEKYAVIGYRTDENKWDIFHEKVTTDQLEDIVRRPLTEEEKGDSVPWKIDKGPHIFKPKGLPSPYISINIDDERIRVGYFEKGAKEPHALGIIPMSINSPDITENLISPGKEWLNIPFTLPMQFHVPPLDAKYKPPQISQ